MLQNARQALAAGRDVVIGYIEPHARPETQALTAGMPTLPPKEIEHRGVTLRESYVDAARPASRGLGGGRACARTPRVHVTPNAGRTSKNCLPRESTSGQRSMFSTLNRDLAGVRARAWPRRDGTQAAAAARIPVRARPPYRVPVLGRRPGRGDDRNEHRRRGLAVRSRRAPCTSPSALRRSTRPCSGLSREPSSSPTSAASRRGACRSRAQSATSASEADRRDRARPRFTDLDRDEDGLARVRLNPQARRSVTVWVDESYPYLMLFTGDPLPDVSRRSIAVEPMTCPPNAFRTGEDVIRLEPGDSTTSTWGIAPGQGLGLSAFPA